jgi:hypothetical protein
MTNKLPTLPAPLYDHKHQAYEHSYSKAQMLEYGQQCRDAALEEAAQECERMVMYPGGRQEAPVHNDVWQAAKAIRGLK